MKQINAERIKGGLPEIGVFDLIAEIRQHEHQSKVDILTKLSKERLNFKVRPNDDELIINGEKFSISSIRYVIEESGREFLEQVNTLFPNKMIFEINKEKPHEIAQKWDKKYSTVSNDFALMFASKTYADTCDYRPSRILGGTGVVVIGGVWVLLLQLAQLPP